VARPDGHIREQDACLYVDVVCTDCGKLMALSNAFQHKNKYLCPRCADPVIVEIMQEMGLEVKR